MVYKIQKSVVTALPFDFAAAVVEFNAQLEARLQLLAGGIPPEPEKLSEELKDVDFSSALDDGALS